MPTDKPKNYDHQFTKIYKKVKADKNLNELQKLILSEIISYQMAGRYFYMTNKQLSYEFGCSEKRIQTAISKLNPLLNKGYTYPKRPEGGRPKRNRLLFVENLFNYVPIEILMEIDIDIKGFKDLKHFLVWAKCTFFLDEVIMQYIKSKPYIEKHFGKIF